MTRPRHLHPVGPRPPQGPSLDFTLMRAVKEFENGRWMAAVEALCDAIELQHHGRHEQVSDDRLNRHLRAIRGAGWTPGEAA